MRRSWLAEAFAGRTIGSEVALPGLDVVFRLAPLAVGPLVEPTWRAAGEVGDDEASVDAPGSGLGAGDDPLAPAPAPCTVVELGVATLLACTAGCGKARRGARRECLDIAAPRR